MLSYFFFYEGSRGWGAVRRQGGGSPKERESLYRHVYVYILRGQRDVGRVGGRGAKPHSPYPPECFLTRYTREQTSYPSCIDMQEGEGSRKVPSNTPICANARAKYYKNQKRWRHGAEAPC